MSTQDRNRQPAGVTVGGQYAHERRDEPAVGLQLTPEAVDLPDAVLSAEEELARARFALDVKRDELAMLRRESGEGRRVRDRDLRATAAQLAEAAEADIPAYETRLAAAERALREAREESLAVALSELDQLDASDPQAAAVRAQVDALRTTLSDPTA